MRVPLKSKTQNKIQNLSKISYVVSYPKREERGYSYNQINSRQKPRHVHSTQQASVGILQKLLPDRALTRTGLCPDPH